MAAGQSTALAYSRQDERQADELGLFYLAKTGYSGEGLVNILKKIRAKKWYTEKEIPTYVTTHPGVEDRIIYTQAWLQGHPTSMPNKSPSTLFPLVKSRLLALYGNKATAAQYFKNKLEHNAHDTAALYGAGVLALASGERGQAERQIQKAIESDPFNPYFLSELGKIYFMNGQHEKAATLLENISHGDPFMPEALLYLGRSQMAADEPQKTVNTLERLLRERDQYTPAFYFLGQAYGKINRQGEAHFHLGKHYFAQKSLKTARFHLKKAEQIVSDDTVKKEIKALLKKIAKALKEQKKAENANR